MLCIDTLKYHYKIYIKIICVILKDDNYSNWWQDNGTYNYVNLANEYCYTIYTKHNKISFGSNFMKIIFNKPTKNDFNYVIKTINNHFKLNLTLIENNVFYTPLNELMNA